jgi:hypothetical protein
MHPRQVVRDAAFRIAPRQARRLQLFRYVESVLTVTVDPSLEEMIAVEKGRNPGIDLREKSQVERVEAWTKYVDLYYEIRNDPQINTWYGGGDNLHNSYYATPDAEIYVSMIGDQKPKRIIEVGGGFSTLIARRAINYFDIDCELIVVDPEPRTQISAAADRVIRSRVEDVPDTLLQQESDAFLFIDSSHVTKIGGDVPFLFLRAIPSLPSGAMVHVHDAFLPFDYPPSAAQYLWTEQYVLEALLTHSARYQIEIASHWLSHTHTELMQHVIGKGVAQDPNHFGGSIWFSVEG